MTIAPSEGVVTRVCVMFIFFHHLRICMGCGDSSIVKIYGEIHLFMTRQKPCLNIDSLYFEKPNGITKMPIRNPFEIFEPYGHFSNSILLIPGLFLTGVHKCKKGVQKAVKKKVCPRRFGDI